ncbi:MAG TPA: FKBP-type peptidyl-prolyl cis-trans isomerase [Opitutaceae bacterium]
MVLALVALGGTRLMAQREKLSPEDYDFVYRKWPNVQKTSTGVRYIVEKEGTGRVAQSGDEVSVFYTGTLLDGTKFDENWNAKSPFHFRLDRGEVIKGWDQILQQMHVGERRLVIVPAELAYGDRGQAPKIPRDAVLVFDMQLIKDVPPPAQ